MAAEGGQERTESATPKRHREAREKGQIPRSRELTSTALLLTSAGCLLMLGDYMYRGLAAIMRGGLHIERARIFDTTTMTTTFATAIWDGVLVSAPVFVATSVAVVLASIALGGFAFNAGAVGFNWSKIDPLEGLGRMFSWRSWVEMLKALAKFGLVAAIMVGLLWHSSERFLALGYEPLHQGLGHAGSLIGWSFLAMSAVMLIIAAVDVPFQLWDHGRQLRMTRQEVRDEMKETEGRPEVKGKIRRMQQEMAQRRMMAEIPRADVVITNPTHFAVALRYDQDKMRAPRVVAKGADLIAARIREIAGTHRVTLVSAPPLARALYHSTQLNQEIPAGLYVAVAKVLAYVFQLREGVRGVHAPGADDLPIPSELRKE